MAHTSALNSDQFHAIRSLASEGDSAIAHGLKAGVHAQNKQTHMNNQKAAAEYHAKKAQSIDENNRGRAEMHAQNWGGKVRRAEGAAYHEKARREATPKTVNGVNPKPGRSKVSPVSAPNPMQDSDLLLPHSPRMVPAAKPKKGEVAPLTSSLHSSTGTSTARTSLPTPSGIEPPKGLHTLANSRQLPPIVHNLHAQNAGTVGPSSEYPRREPGQWDGSDIPQHPNMQHGAGGARRAWPKREQAQAPAQDPKMTVNGAHHAAPALQPLSRPEFTPLHTENGGGINWGNHK